MIVLAIPFGDPINLENLRNVTTLLNSRFYTVCMPATQMGEIKELKNRI